MYVIGTEWIYILGIRGGGTNQMNDIISRNSCQVHCCNFFSLDKVLLCSLRWPETGIHLSDPRVPQSRHVPPYPADCCNLKHAISPQKVKTT